MKLKKVFPIVAMLLIVLMAGCKKDDYTGVSPAVNSTDPLNNVTGVPRNTKAKKQFFNFPATFVWISDIHVGSDSWQAGEIEAEVSAINSKNADFVVASGDLTENGIQSQVDAFETVMSVLTMPLYKLRGNHDGGQFTQHFIVDILNVRLIAFYASYVGLPIEGDIYNNTGLVSQEELTWIETQLQSAGNKRCILICHYPLSSSIWGYIQPGYGAEEIIALCNLYGIKVYLSGHNHGVLGSYVVGDNTTNIDAYAMRSAEQFMVCTIYSDRLVITPYNGTAPFAATTPVRVIYF